MKFIYLNNSNKKTHIFDKPGKYIVFFHNISGDYKFLIKSKNVDLDIFGIIIGKGNDKFNINTDQIHIAPNSKSNLLVKGILFDNSKFQFKGLIKIEKTGIKTKAYQKNQNLLMSKDCFVDTKPYLEILADDVFCTHGSTTSQLDKNAIYYLNTRSLDNKKAGDILMKGFINEIFELIKYSLPDKQYLALQSNIIKTL